MYSVLLGASHVLQVDNASFLGAMKLACSEMGLQAVEPFLEKVRLSTRHYVA